MSASSAATPMADVLWLPDVNVWVHLAEKLGRAWADVDTKAQTPLAMLQVLKADEFDDAATDFIRAAATHALVTAPLILTTVARVLIKDLNWPADRAADVVKLMAFNAHRVPVTQWSEVKDRALGPMYDLIDELAPQHLADIDVHGAALRANEPRVDGEDLGVFVVLEMAEEIFDRPVIYASGDQEACQAVVKARLATVTRLTRNFTTNRLHASSDSVRVAGPTPAPSPSRTVHVSRAPANASPARSATISK